MPDEPKGAGDGSQDGSEKVYTETQFRELQSSLGRQVADAQTSADTHKRSAESLQSTVDSRNAHIEELEAAAKDSPERVGDVKRKREMDAREAELTKLEETIAKDRLESYRSNAATTLGVKPEDLHGNSEDAIRVSVLEAQIKVIKGEPPKQQTLVRGPTGELAQDPLTGKQLIHAGWDERKR